MVNEFPEDFDEEGMGRLAPNENTVRKWAAREGERVFVAHEQPVDQIVYHADRVGRDDTPPLATPQAWEAHFSDLRSYMSGLCQRITDAVGKSRDRFGQHSEVRPADPREARLQEDLKAHCPTSPLWGLLEERGTATEKGQRLFQATCNRAQCFEGEMGGTLHRHCGYRRIGPYPVWKTGRGLG